MVDVRWLVVGTDEMVFFDYSGTIRKNFYTQKTAYRDQNNKNGSLSGLRAYVADIKNAYIIKNRPVAINYRTAMKRTGFLQSERFAKKWKQTKQVGIH